MNSGEEKAAAQAELRLASSKVATARADTRFTQQDLDRVNTKVAGEVKTLTAELERANAAWDSCAARRRRGDEAPWQTRARRVPLRTKPRTRSRCSRAARALPPTSRSGRAENAEHGARERQDAQLALAHYEGRAWATRFELARTKDLPRAASAYENLVGVADRAAVVDRVSEAAARQHDELPRHAWRRGCAARRLQKHATLRELRDVYVQREAILRGSLVATQPLERMFSRWRASVASRTTSRPLADRVRDGWVVGTLWVKRLWNFELFSVEDSFETAEGRKIAAQRSVTIGKTVGAALLIFVGYWLCSAARAARTLGVGARAAQHAGVGKHRLPLDAGVPGGAAHHREPARGQIPLTVFAFLGGALAIGIGFGAQNLLKNLMSGIMLLIEKPLRVGDLIEFGNIRGRVTNIGFRASIVRPPTGSRRTSRTRRSSRTTSPT